jgi:hypothetical protein
MLPRYVAPVGKPGIPSGCFGEPRPNKRLNAEMDGEQEIRPRKESHRKTTALAAYLNLFRAA